MRTRLVAAIGFLLAAVGVTSWGLISASGANVHHAGRPRASVSPTPPPIALPSLIPSNWQLAFNPSFKGSTLDTNVWETCYPWALANTPAGCTNTGHTEYEWYLPSQDRVSHGLLKLVAQRLPTPGLDKNNKPTTYACRSGIVTTYHSFQFEYGAVQVVARMPAESHVGMWPALWLLPVNEKFPPEIDIVEHWVRPNQPQFETGVFLHARMPKQTQTTNPAPTGYNYVQTDNLAVGWHIFTLVWKYHQLEWLIDNKIALVVHQHIPHQPMYFLANLADSRAAKYGCGGAFVIKSVKIWTPPKS